MLTGDVASLRLPFAFSGLNERYGDVTPIKAFDAVDSPCSLHQRRKNNLCHDRIRRGGLRVVAAAREDGDELALWRNVDLLSAVALRCGNDDLP